jgi:hypothetical protein
MKITDPLPKLEARIRKDLFEDEKNRNNNSDSFLPCLNRFKEDLHIRKAFILLLLFSVSLRAIAPSTVTFTLFESSPVKPFAALMFAVGMVETMGNTLAFNELENAAGIFQIRQVRVDEYNRLTDSNYTLADMFDYETSEKVFLYFASLVGPYNLEKIAKEWNGSGPKTEFYWQRVKEYL